MLAAVSISQHDAASHLWQILLYPQLKGANIEHTLAHMKYSGYYEALKGLDENPMQLDLSKKKRTHVRSNISLNVLFLVVQQA